MPKPPTQFRAVPSELGMRVEYSVNGVNWNGSVDGLSEDDVLAAFARLRAQGAIIVEDNTDGH